VCWTHGRYFFSCYWETTKWVHVFIPWFVYYTYVPFENGEMNGSWQ
jgi:hypothetical protein